LMITPESQALRVCKRKLKLTCKLIHTHGFNSKNSLTDTDMGVFSAFSSFGVLSYIKLNESGLLSRATVLVDLAFK
jgi:hypothetical protein